MPLERDYVLLYGPKEIVEEGLRIRNKVLQPCGCWEAEVWRAAMVYNRAAGEFKEGTEFEWHPQTGQCSIHSAAVVVTQQQLAVSLARQGMLLEGQRGDAPPKRISEETYLARLGDGARRLYADRDRVLAEASVLDKEITALGSTITHKQIGDDK